MAPSANKEAAFFNDILKDSDPEFVKHAKEVLSSDPVSGSLMVSASNSSIMFQTDVCTGLDDCTKKGVDKFQGTELKSHVQGSTFKLWLMSTMAKLELYDGTLMLVDMFNGTGLEFGLDTTGTTPWEGDWN
ncbi:hypothetical protein EWM64_g1335 [Hericium alpestre]|uniref:Uncharacterized protein n=1 Tax=Hericium alpestre TaxID=135208 RepID=A0A4Z0A8N1_9AGAM|nr:hypothetical protein EWM64_g1335 [Hericium alpestre]